ncbi:hypothetical protein CMI37_31610 [Candidatus Pacearchaeota archaeon]|nr:hypothetical protein [Candidatus Pacearchaeota archaeon]|tara:strand:+ start:54 stop:443 length:390 start_codon:yes stop_codon:yes gene_type:complete
MASEKVSFDQVASFVATVGIPGAFCFILLWVIWAMLKKISPKVSDAFDEHMALVKTLKETNIQTTAAMLKQTELLASLDDQHRSVDAPFSTVRTNDALMHAGKALQCLAGEDRQQAATHAANMQDSLKK